MKSYKILGVGLSLLVSPTLCLAHAAPVSEGLYAGFLHPLSGWDHLAAFMLAGLMIGMQHKARPFIPALLLALGGGALTGMALGAQAWIEAAVLLSLPVLLVFVMCRRAGVQNLALGICAGFFVAHGWAHGVDVTGSAPAFIAGFVSSSALVLAAASALARRIRTHSGAARYAG